MTTKLRKTLPGILLSVLITTAAACPADAAKLTAARIGRHSDFSRIVFEFEAPARYQVRQEEGAQRITVVFFDSSGDVAQPLAPANSSCITAAVIAKQDNDIVADITLSSPQFRLKPFIIQEPFRMVLDIYCRQAVEAAPLSPQSAEGPASNAIIAQSLESEDQKAQPRPQSHGIRQIKMPASINEPVGRPAEKKFMFPKNMIALLAVLSLIIIILIGVIALQYRTRRGKSASDARRMPMKASNDMLVSIDARIREKLQSNKNR